MTVKILDGETYRRFLTDFMEKHAHRGIFFKDLKKMPLDPCDERGKNSTSIFFDMNTRTMEAHVSEIPPGTNKKAHRHVIEAIIYIISGRGYSLMWAEGEEPQRYDWEEGDLFAVPIDYWHQHFNLDPEEPARYLAITNVHFMLALGLFDAAQIE